MISGSGFARARSVWWSARRSAVFAPLDRVGLIIVDEEHDGSYKQDESPRYNGRDVAIVRGQRAGALVLLGSATPSMETYHHAMTGKYERVVLERRVQDRPLAAVTVVDMREEYANGGPDVIISRALQAKLESRLALQEQAVVLLNRRGYRDSRVLPPVRGDGRLSELQCLARRARRGHRRPPRPLSLLQLLGARAEHLSGLCRALPGTVGIRHRTRRSRALAGFFPTPAWPGWTATPSAGADRWTRSS